MRKSKSLLPFVASFFAASAALALAWSTLQGAREALTRAHWFHLTDDEALHVELIEVLARTGRYEPWAGPPFAPVLTTGPTLLAPAAALKALVPGVSSARAGRAVALAYHALALVLAAGIALAGARALRTGLSKTPPTSPGSPWGASGQGARLVLAIAAVGVFTLGWRGLQDTNYYMYGVLGEGPAAAFALLAFFATLVGHPGVAGAAAAGASLSKPYFVLLIPLTILCQPWKARAWVWALAGAAAPWAAWVGWMAWVLGPDETARYWLQYPATMRNLNGAGLPTSGGWDPLAQARAHLTGLSAIARPRALGMAAVGLALAAAWMRRGRALGGRARAFHRLCFTYGLAHAAWWFLLSPGVQARYLMPALLAGWAALLPTVTRWMERGALWAGRKLGLAAREGGGRSSRLAPRGGMIRVRGVAALATFAAAPFALDVARSWRETSADWAACGLCRQLDLQAYWRAHGAGHTAWTTTLGYAGDKDLVLTAPHGLRFFNPADPVDAAALPPGTWVIVGENPRPGTDAFLLRRGCEAQHVIPRTNEGFWVCP